MFSQLYLPVRHPQVIPASYLFCEVEDSCQLQLQLQRKFDWIILDDDDENKWTKSDFNSTLLLRHVEYQYQEWSNSLPHITVISTFFVELTLGANFSLKYEYERILNKKFGYIPFRFDDCGHSCIAFRFADSRDSVYDASTTTNSRS